MDGWDREPSTIKNENERLSDLQSAYFLSETGGNPPAVFAWSLKQVYKKFPFIPKSA